MKIVIPSIEDLQQVGGKAFQLSKDKEISYLGSCGCDTSGGCACNCG